MLRFDLDIHLTSLGDAREFVLKITEFLSTNISHNTFIMKTFKAIFNLMYIYNKSPLTLL